MEASKNLDNLRHSAAHLLAAAVMQLYPSAKRTIGPAIENGFYFDFDFGDIKISESDFPKIEAKMRELLPSWKEFQHHELSAEQAKKEYPGNEYKHELIEEFTQNGEKVSFYKSGEYWDLCKGGHCAHPNNALKHFKLLSVAGAYWRGDEKNKMLTRIYGTVFPSKTALEEYLNQIEEAKKRDHRKLGKEMDLFTFSEHVGSGLPLYTPKGALVRKLLNDYIEEEQVKLGYTQVWTPQIAKASLFKLSGHYDKYKEDMFQVVSHYSEEEYYLKPMNCPQHTQIYSSKPRSYRDLPLRYSDFAMLYRDERPGQLNGLARVRSFSTDDCHIFCREDQVDHEVDAALQMTKKVMDSFGFKYRYRLSTRDPQNKDKYLGHPETWDKVEAWAVRIMQRNNIPYFDGPGEAAFYAPKMDLMVTDAIGREWQLSTVQIDYVQPERFGLRYIDEHGKEQTPVMIHRAVLGSSERAMMILLEHFAGKFPLWLAPVQMTLVPIAERHVVYAKEVAEILSKGGIRVELDERSESMQSKVRDATLQKVPFIGIIGDKEVAARSLSLRSRDGSQQNGVAVSSVLETLQTDIERKKIS